ncbi:DNA alkylation repair protein [Arthrobacter sp. JSM 101049]|uniref:DNA alkylation repair protein n=1 Tax=Arthrobacter sp. JSM 101049 TaxID=929097 RepID=UPI003566338C
MTSTLPVLITQRLAAAGDPGTAADMQRYMKTRMPFLGVRAPIAQRIVRETVRELGTTRWEDFHSAAQELWESAGHREQWYAAQQLTGYRSCSGRLEFLDLYERMVLDGAWWDIVDNCHRRFGGLLREHPDHVDPLLRSWAIHPNHWKRRSAIIAQLGAKADTDVALLEAAILPNLVERDFFLRKAIGWALREYAKTDPEWVRTFVARHEPRLSGLSRREALKNLPVR